LKPIAQKRRSEFSLRRFLSGISSRWLTLLFDEPFIFIVRPNPNPDEVTPILQGESPVMRPRTNRPKFANFLKV
jgi:hypothetical protein